jgi:CRP/FNR family transcriptional regulator
MRAIAAVSPGSTVRVRARYNASSVKVEHYPTSCATCNVRESCLPGGANELDARLMDGMNYARRRIRRGESLYHAGAPFESIYVVRSGFFKSFAITEDGDEQVTGFQMAGEVIGFDGIESDSHTLNVRALEDSLVCVIPFAQLERMASRSLGLQRQLHRLMSREIIHDHGVMTLLATMDAEERVASFLLDLSQRFVARGYAAAEFLLRMTREEIGSYLGLTLETVSRIFSRFQQSRLIDVQSRRVCILDSRALKALIGTGNVKRYAKPRLALVG